MERICKNHPNLCSFVEHVDGLSHLHLVMEEVNGGNLRQELNRKQCRRLAEETAADYFRQICCGIAFLHSNLVVHRDVKLENLLLQYQPIEQDHVEGGPQAEGAGEQQNPNSRRRKVVIKIVDFGFAVKLQSGTQKLKVFCGTPSYMSPEIVAGKEYSGFQSDVWALGVVGVIFGVAGGGYDHVVGC